MSATEATVAGTGTGVLNVGHLKTVLHALVSWLPVTDEGVKVALDTNIDNLDSTDSALVELGLAEPVPEPVAAPLSNDELAAQVAALRAELAAAKGDA